jgi:hypothetical protein
MARQQLLETDSRTLRELLSDGSYRVPLYQRDYAWGPEQWDALWQDVVDSRTSTFPHYMGAVVLQRMESGGFHVIDGQQRLATSIVACTAVLELLKKRGEDERFDELRRVYVGAPDPGSLRWQSKLTLNENDDAFFQEFIVNLRDPPKNARLPESNRRLLEARRFFSERFQAFVGPDASGEQLVNAFSESMGARLQFTIITVDDELKAYSVFETLNARSLQLTSTDLLKNFLFSLLKGGRIDIDQAQKQWRRIVETVDAEELPSFLRQFWNSRRKLVRADRLFREVKAEITTRESSFGLLDDLEETAVNFRALADPNDGTWSGSSGCKKHIRVLNLLEVSQHVPLLLACMAQGFDPGRLETVLRCCLMVFFRHTVVGRRNPSDVEQKFNQLAVAVSDGTLTNPRGIWLGVDGRAGLRDVYVSDEDFKADFARLDLNRRGRRAKLPRYILFEIDARLGGAAADVDTSNETLEHVLPENPGSAWTSFNDEDHRRFSNRLGNYVLLDGAQNRLLGNADFATKASTYCASARPTTKMAGEFPSWTPAAIEERQRRLAEAAVDIWRFDIA